MEAGSASGLPLPPPDTTADTGRTIEMQDMRHLPVSIHAARRLNAYSVSYRLPAEILCKIFLFAAAKYRQIELDPLDYEPCTDISWIAEVSHVCWYWRQAAVSYAELWNHIVAEFSTPWIYMFLERSLSMPLTVIAELSEHLRESAFIVVVANAISRIQHLRVQGWRRSFSRYFPLGQAVLLETLELDTHENDPWPGASDHSLPSLRRLQLSAPTAAWAPVLKCTTSLQHLVIRQHLSAMFPREFIRILRSMQDLETLSWSGSVFLPEEGMKAIRLSRLRFIHLSCWPSLAARFLTMLSPLSDVRLKFEWSVYGCNSVNSRDMRSLQAVLSPIISLCTIVSIRKEARSSLAIIASYSDASQEPSRTLVDPESAPLVIQISYCVTDEYLENVLEWLCRLLPFEKIQTLELVAKSDMNPFWRARGAWKKRLKNVTVVRTTMHIIEGNRILGELWADPQPGSRSRDQVPDDELFFIPRLEALQVVGSEDKSKESDYMEEILRRRRQVLDERKKMST